MVLGCWSCGDSTAGPDTGAAEDCTAVGTEHADTIKAAETWLRSDGPHHVTGSVAVGYGPLATLTIEPGTLVCFAPGASLGTAGATEELPGGGSRPIRGGVLIAQGTEDRPIVFTARDSLDPWGGITIPVLAGHSLISHAVVEHAQAGIVGQGTVDIDHTVIRQIRGTGIVYWRYNESSRITNTVVDGAGLDGTPAVSMGGGTLDQTIIRNSGGTGLQLTARYAGVRIERCAISGNAGDGIEVTYRTLSVVPINDCNLEGNGGLGINSHSQAQVDATRNWWGDPEGPLGPEGDGVSGNVEYSPYRAEPVAMGSTVP